ncbi:MAG: HNH endonuclease [Ilumatobacteraceae bacterium]
MGTTLTPPPLAPTGDFAPASPHDDVPIEQLEVTIWQGAANLTAAEHDWLRAVAAFDRRRGWERWEAHSCAHWLSWQVSLDLGAAREKVRVAHALDRFALIAAAMADGTLSYSKVRAISRIATPATEQALVEMALGATTNQVERMVSARRRAEPSDDDQDRAQWAERGMWHRVRPNGSVAITLVLPPVEATTFLSAVEQYAPPAEPDDDGTFEPRAARRADGAVAAAAAAHAAMAQTLSTPQYLVTLHADVDMLLADDTSQETCTCSHDPSETSQETSDHASQETSDPTSQETSDHQKTWDRLVAALVGDKGGESDPRPNRADRRRRARDARRCEVEGHGDACELPIGVSRATALRMLCDADFETLVTKADVMGLTGRSSVIAGRLRRLVLARDRCCQYPGCGRRAGVQVHHVRERHDGGTNELANLTVLCHFHHRRVHEGGWRLHRDGHGYLVFMSPTGRMVTQAPPSVTGDEAAVASMERTADHGRSQWLGDPLHLDLTMQALDDLERLGGRWQPRTP